MRKCNHRDGRASGERQREGDEHQDHDGALHFAGGDVEPTGRHPPASARSVQTAISVFVR